MAGKHLKKKDNLWILFNGKEYCVGLTNEAQEELGDITFANLPKAGQSLKKDEDINILNDSDEMNAWILSFKDVDPKEFDEL